MYFAREVLGALIRFYHRFPANSRIGKRLAQLLGLLTYFRRHKIVIAHRGGLLFELCLGEMIDAKIYYAGEYEPQASSIMRQCVGPGMTVIDVGANIGYHALHLARAVGPGGRVLAVEPTSAAFARLERNVGLNGFENVACLRIALADADLGLKEAGFESSWRLDGVPEIKTEPIEFKTLDTLVEEMQLERLDFVKIDVDGYEAKVFRGGEATLRRFRPKVLFEIGPGNMKPHGDRVADISAMLDSFGYVLQTETGRRVEDLERFCAGRREQWTANLLATPRG